MNGNNGALRGVLGGVYILLIALLMLSNCHGCDNDHITHEDQTAEERAENIGSDGEIKVTALWDFPGDVDLHVTEPDGTELWYRNMKHRRTGGELDVDNISGGYGAAENIYWTRPLRGLYKVEVVLYKESPEAPNGGLIKVVVKTNGETETIPVTLQRRGQRMLVKKFMY